MAAACAVLVALTLVGCPRSGSPATEPEEDSPKDDPLAGAPQNAEEFAAWAEEQLTRFPPPVPLPEQPRLAEPKWPVLHLDGKLQRANVESDWKKSAHDSRPLVSLGPFRSDQPNEDFSVKEEFDRKLGRFVLMDIRGFEVDCEDVGSIVLNLRAPFGKHVDLLWAKVGSIRLPITDNQKFWSLRVSTDGLAEWRGRLRRIRLRIDEVGEGVVEIRSLRLYGHKDAFPESVGVGRVTLNRVRRKVIYAHCPSTITFPDLAVPDRAKLRVGLGLSSRLGMTGGTAQAPVTAAEFEIRMTADGRAASVLRRRLERADQWEDVSVSLERWQGKNVSIALRTTSPRPNTVAFWADPVIYQPVDDAPIVIIYLIDTVSAEHIGLHGYNRATMPNLTNLAHRGVWFENSYCNSPVTIASVADLMLSMPTERHGVYSYSVSAPEQLVTLAEALRAAGFATFSMVTNVNAGPRQNMDQGFDTFLDHISFIWEEETDRTVPIEDVITWIEQHRDRAMFLYIHTAEPHSPYLPPPGFAGRFDADYGGSIDGTLHGFKKAKAPRDVEHVRALYDEEVLYADARLGLFLEALARAGVVGRTNIFVTADHGEELLDHGRWGHGPGIYNEILQIPLVVAGPNVTARGRMEQPAQIYDLMPTILDLFDVPRPYALQGRSLVPLLDGRASQGAATKTRTVVHSHHRFWGHGFVEYVIIESARWKLCFQYDAQPIEPGGPASRFQLFDLESDPDEQINLAKDKPEVVRRLVGKLIEYKRRQPAYDHTISADELEYDPEQLRQLRALGYIK